MKLLSAIFDLISAAKLIFLFDTECLRDNHLESMLDNLYVNDSVCFEPVAVRMGRTGAPACYREMFSLLTVDVRSLVDCTCHKHKTKYRDVKIIEIFHDCHIQNTVAAVSQRCHFSGMSPSV